MPRVTLDTVDQVARLARLSLADEERELFARQLEQILEWADSLRALDVADVPPLAHGLEPAWRADEVRPGLSRERALESAPDPAEGLFRVPKVIA